MNKLIQNLFNKNTTDLDNGLTQLPYKVTLLSARNLQPSFNTLHSHYCDVCVQLNGINTQGENIADNGGIKEAYYAYLRWTERNYVEPRLPGLNYSPRQMFWMSAAQTWCTKYRIQAMRQRITTGVHSLGQFRVLGPLSNMIEFSEDFNCPLGSPMNPVHKCQVWWAL